MRKRKLKCKEVSEYKFNLWCLKMQIDYDFIKVWVHTSYDSRVRFWSWLSRATVKSFGYGYFGWKALTWWWIWMCVFHTRVSCDGEGFPLLYFPSFYFTIITRVCQCPKRFNGLLITPSLLNPKLSYFSKNICLKLVS